MIITALPSCAAEYKDWMRLTFSAVTTCSIDSALSGTWIRKLSDPATTFEQLREVEGFKNLDEKLMHAIHFKMNDESGKKRVGLVTEMKRHILDHEHRRIAEPNGRQLLHIIRSYYEIQPEEKDMFDLKVLWDLQYWGDAQLHPWKSHWDYLLRMQREPPTDRTLRSFFPLKLKNPTRLSKYSTSTNDRARVSPGKRTPTWER